MTWPEDEARELQDAAASVGYTLQAMDVLATLRQIERITRLSTEIASAVIEIAGEETKLTQKALAEALGVPPRYLSGLRQR